MICICNDAVAYIILNPLGFEFEPRNSKSYRNFILQKYHFPNMCGQPTFISFSVATYLQLDGENVHTRLTKN